MIVRSNTPARKPDPYVDLMNMRSDQVVLASKAYQEFKFPPEIKVKSVEGWAVSTFDGVDDFKRHVLVTSTDEAGVEGEITRLAFHVEFEESTKVLATSYAKFSGEAEFFSYEAPEIIAAPARRMRP